MLRGIQKHIQTLHLSILHSTCDRLQAHFPQIFPSLFNLIHWFFLLIFKPLIVFKPQQEELVNTFLTHLVQQVQDLDVTFRSTYQFACIIG